VKLIGGDRPESVWLYAAAGVLMFAGSLWQELHVNQYPIGPEVFLWIAVAVVVGAAAAICVWRIGGLVGTLGFGVLLFLFADLQLDLKPTLSTLFLPVGCLVFAFLFARHRAALVTVSLMAFFGSALIRPMSSALASTTTMVDSVERSGLPPIVHIVLDEQWGIGGLRAVGDTSTANFLTNFYLARGFEVHEAAYSHYMWTTESLPQILSMGEVPSLSPDTRRGGIDFTVRLRRNAYFEELRRLGYGIRVYQNTYLDLCGDSAQTVAACHLVSANSIANIGTLEGSLRMRAVLGARFYLGTRSDVFQRLTRQPNKWNRAVTGGAILSMNRLTSDILGNQGGGNAHFLHALLPHRPVQVDANCRILDDPSEIFSYELPALPKDSAWRAVLRSYAGQVRCAHKVLAEVLDAIDRTAGSDNSIVIVHGDHGSRIGTRGPPGESLQSVSADLLNANYSTLLAVRRPGVPSAVHAEPVPVQDFIWELTRGKFTGSVSATWNHELRDRGDRTAQRLFLTPATMLWMHQPD
jgi:hypothetical protein